MSALVDSRLVVAAIVVEVAETLPLDEARAAAADWLVDYPEVAEAASVVIAHRAGLMRAYEEQVERLAGRRWAAVLLCYADPRGLDLSVSPLVCDVGPIVAVRGLRRVLDVLSARVAPLVSESVPDLVDLQEYELVPETSQMVTADLLYVAVLGRPGWFGRRVAANQQQELVDLVARHAPGRLLRLLALGDGIVGRTSLGLPSDVSSANPQWTTRQWPVASGRLSMRPVVADLLSQLARDEEQARFEGVDVGHVSCVILAYEQLSGVSHLAPQLAALAAAMDLLWVAGDAGVRRWPAGLAGSRHFAWHPEVAAEVARALGIGARQLDGRLVDEEGTAMTDDLR